MACISASGTGCAAPTAGSAASIRRAGAALAAAAALGAAPAARLDVSVEALRSAKGELLVCLTRSADAFPNCANDRAARRLQVPTGRELSFADVPSGDYALAVVHDENGNGRLDTIAGIPREGIGFSRNPSLMWGPPRFAAARFRIGAGATSQDVTMKYFF